MKIQDSDLATLTGAELVPLSIPDGSGGFSDGHATAQDIANLASAGSGKMLNYVYAAITDTALVSVASWTSIASISITPGSAENLVKYEALLNLGIESAGYPTFLRVTRNGTPIQTGVGAGSRPGIYSSVIAGGSTYGMSANAIHFMDAPGTTDAVTYEVEALIYDTGHPLGVNRSTSDADAGYYPRTSSHLCLMELAP